MASRKSKNAVKRQIIAKVKGVDYVPKTPRLKKAKGVMAPKRVLPTVVP